MLPEVYASLAWAQGVMNVEMARQEGMIDFEKPQSQTHVPEEPPPRKKGGRKPGQICVTFVRHAKKELIGIYNELKRGEIDPQVAQARRASSGRGLMLIS